ncbi:MAG: zinc-dependent alcohol dehydrogenase [Candidatus Promineifilaceae bacterium]
MKAVRFNASIPRYAFGITLGRLARPLLWSGLACAYAQELPEPRLPADDWVVVRTRYGGICGTDLGTIHLHTSPYYLPFSSFPFTLGHENCGRLAAVGPAAGAWQVGQRVVVEPLLWCRPRGFDELCPACAQGEINRCLRFGDGRLAPGMFIGACRDTGGSWSDHFVAHASQLYAVPDAVSDENALMVEPFACGLHAALQSFPADDETVLIIGAGTMGLVTLAALRALGSAAAVLVVARHPFQAAAARRLGASDALSGDAYAGLADRGLGRVFHPLIGKRVFVGGADLTFECAGSDEALDDALRLTRPGGRVALVGAAGLARGVDWTAVFAQELDVRGAFTYHRAEQFGGQRWSAFGLSLALMAQGKLDLGWLVSHRYPLAGHRRALGDAGRRRRNQSIKAVFEFD